MKRNNLLSILAMVFVIFVYRDRSIDAGQANITCSRELNGPIIDEDYKFSDEDEDDDEDENANNEGSSIFLSGELKFPEKFPLDFDEPSDDDKIMKDARVDMCEIGIPGLVEDAKRKLRRKLKEDKQLKTPWRNDAWLIRFLRAKRYDVNETYKLIQKYYQFKKDYQKFFNGMIPSKLVADFNKNILLPLPNRDKKGRRILIFKAKTWNSKAIGLNEIFVTALLLAEAASYEPKTQLTGVQIIVDWEGFSYKHTMQFVLGGTTVLAIIQWLQNSIPFRLKGLHIVNPSANFMRISGLFDKRATPIMKERVHIHEPGTDLKILYEKYDFDESNLPPSYGGTLSLESANNIDWENILKYCDREFEEMLSYGYKKN